MSTKNKSLKVWRKKPASNKWNTSANWEPAEVPTESASFGKSEETDLVFSPTGAAVVDEIVFEEGAPSYTFTFGSSDNPQLTISGKGISNQSGHPQSFIVASVGVSFQSPQLKFINAASAGGSDVIYTAGPTSLEQGYGGGIIGFCDKATAGSASFVVRTGAVAPPGENSTVGGEVSFSNNSTAGTARFTIYGTLGTDGDTFGNTVFHDQASADHGTFTNMGGTVSGGDGGNTQFYNNSSAANGLYLNYGGTVGSSNGGDVAFDGVADGGNGLFQNFVAKAHGAYGGVTSFNNNPPNMDAAGASAGNGIYHNFGAIESSDGGGGHTEFTAKHGCPTAGNGNFINYGSAIAGSSSAGHTIFSINLPTNYFPTAANGVFWNRPAIGKAGVGGFTEFAVYGSGAGTNMPTAGYGTFFNLGGYSEGAGGGYTSFKNSSTAGNATLIATSGVNGGYGGVINFYDQSTGGNANVQLFGNGELSVCDHTNALTIGALNMTGGIIRTQLGSNLTTIVLSGRLQLNAKHATFYFRKTDGDGFVLNTPYKILRATNLAEFSVDQFEGNSLDGVEPTFSIDGNDLIVSFNEN